MKIRNGFVSNSSSSSFLIIGKEKKKIFEEISKVSTFPIKELIETIGNITIKELANFDYNRKDIPFYMVNNYYDLSWYYKDLEEIYKSLSEEELEETYFSDEVDRDWAYLNISFLNLPVFKGDL